MKRMIAVVFVFCVMLSACTTVQREPIELTRPDSAEYTEHEENVETENDNSADSSVNQDRKGDSNFAEYVEYFEDLSQIGPIAGRTYVDEQNDRYSFNEDGYCDYVVNMRTETGTEKTSFHRPYTVKDGYLYLNTVNSISVYEMGDTTLVKTALIEGENPQTLHEEKTN